MPATVAVHARPFCLFHQAGVTRLATGEIKRVELLADLPRPTGLPIISMVPYAQLKERGFELHDGGEAILSLVVDECREVDLEAMMDTTDPDFTVGEVSFGMTDDEFTDIIRRIIEDEICQGEGSNFLISRRGRVRIEGFSSEVAKTVFRRLVRNELGAYFTFCFFDGERYFIGSSPERHITFTGETVVMNPICGTLPKTAINSRADLVDFLTDPKEVNELFQVVDEELKMMARICSEGGVVKGPYLKEMGAVVHTEYLLEGHSTMDKIDAFRDSMFAATMVGSPLENAARIIRKYEHESRRYYSSAIMVHGLDEDGADYLDSAITIRTMEISAEGDVLLQSGCSVVRDSSPEKETKEVQAKMAGLLRALRSTERTEPVLDRYVDDHVRRILTSRNAHLSRFWTDDQQGSVLTEPPARKSVLIVDNEDEFTHMLGHILSHLGLDVTVRDYDDPTLELGAADLVLIGPGPGDPRVDSDPKMRRVRQIVTELLDSRAKFIAVCLGHQIVSQQLGMDIVRIDPPLQGVQKQVDLFGQHELVGFYNTFFAERPQTAPADVEVATTPDGHVVALRAENYCTFQFHVESLLTSNCVSILRRALEWLR